MKKITILFAAILLFAGISFAIPYQATPAKPKTEKKADKKTEKKEVKKVPARKTVSKTKTATTPAAPANK
jgi:hypothetical protein